MSETMLIKILEAIEENTTVLRSFIAKMEALQPHEEYKKIPEIIVKEEPQVEEEFYFENLKDVMVMAKTPKAVLVVKQGHQLWIALQHIDIVQREAGFEIGQQYNIELLEGKHWILEKPVEKFKPMKKSKGGGN